MTVVGIHCKFSEGAAAAEPRVGVDVNRDGHIQVSEDVRLDAKGPGEWTGQITVPSHTINMLALVAYEMNLGAKLTIEAKDAVTEKSLWKREITAVTSRIGWALGYLG